MKFSTRTTYGLRSMIQLAARYGKDNVSLASIAKQEKISLKYLERIFASLKKEGLIISEKGSTGGYSLSRAPKEINVFEIVKALEGNMAPFHCLDESGKIFCSSKCKCGATTVLVKVQHAINSTLKGINLDELI
jgi:Rrf2 family protein